MFFKKLDIATRVSFVTIICNVLLALFKLFAGFISKSGAMISDAVHTLSDVFSTFVVIIGVRLSSKDSDREHQYGHERIECIASVLLAVILFITGLGIGYSCLTDFFSGNYNLIEIPGVLALVAAVVSIMIKEWMYWYTLKASRKVNSSAMLADAWHHRSDALSSVGALIGIMGARIGFPILDSVASFLISILICKAAIDIFRDATNKLVDKSCDDSVVLSMEDLIKLQGDFIKIDYVKTRLFGNRIYVDVEISLDGNKSLFESHLIAEKIHDAIEEKFSCVKHCMVHVNPLIANE